MYKTKVCPIKGKSEKCGACKKRGDRVVQRCSFCVNHTMRQYMMPLVIATIIIVCSSVVVDACLLCPGRDTGAALYQGNAVMRVRGGRKQLTSEEMSVRINHCATTVPTDCATRTVCICRVICDAHRSGHVDTCVSRCIADRPCQ